jgi:ethanolamine ammonia-lyase small subunit
MTDLRRYTMARVGLGRAGNAVPVRAMLEFQLAHARARDAVHFPLNPVEFGGVILQSAARDRAEYLRRPDLGRRLSDASRAQLTPLRAAFDIAFVIADGLSALAVHRNARPLLEALIPRLDTALRIAPLTVVEQGRVAIGDEIGELLGAALVVVLIGERPGLSSPDSLGAYLTWNPRPGRTDAERNCISNIRPEGLSIGAAAELLLFLISEARAGKLSGVHLKAMPNALPSAP